MPNRLFNITPDSTGENSVTSAGVINAPQSALTFAGAPALVTLVVRVIGAINAHWGDSKTLVVGLSLLVGMLIYWNTHSTARTLKKRVMSFTFALLNSFVIAAASLGINTA